MIGSPVVAERTILYVDQTGQLGGGELAILPWLHHSAAEARVVLLQDGPFRELLEAAGVPVTVLNLGAMSTVRRESGGTSIFRSIPDFLRIRSVLARESRNVSLVYANSQKAFLLAALSKRRGQPLVWHLRDILTSEHFSPLLRRVAVAIGNRFADRILVNSNATAEALIAAGGAKGKVTVVYDGVSSEPFDRLLQNEANSSTKEHSPSTSIRRALGLPEATPLVGIFGRLSEWKGQSVLLEAVASLPGVHVVLVGDALFGEQAYADSLRVRAAERDLASRVHFLGFRRDIPTLMRAMDIIVHASIAPEPFGLVIVEGMLSGRPVIATCAGGAVEIIKHNESGLLVTPGDVSELREAIKFLMANGEKAQKLAQNGRERAKESFSLQRMLDSLQAAIDGVLQS